MQWQLAIVTLEVSEEADEIDVAFFKKSDTWVGSIFGIKRGFHHFLFVCVCVETSHSFFSYIKF